MLLYIQHKYMSNLILEPADVVFHFNFHYAFGSVAAPIFLLDSTVERGNRGLIAVQGKC